MPKLSPLLIAAACGMCTALALAQEASPSAVPLAAATDAGNSTEKKEETKPKPAPKPTTKPESLAPAQAPTAEAVATPAPKEKKPNFFQRLFGRKKKVPAEGTPAPAASPTPAGRRVVRRLVTPTPKPDEATTPKPTKVAAATPAPRGAVTKAPATPKPDMPKLAATTTPAQKAPSTTPAPKAPAATPAKKPASTPSAAITKPPVPEPPADADPEVKEKYRYEQAKAKASEDPHVKGLKAKADDATTDEESRKALRAYNKALFEKIRKIDSSVTDRADRMEAAILKRLSE